MRILINLTQEQITDIKKISSSLEFPNWDLMDGFYFILHCTKLDAKNDDTYVLLENTDKIAEIIEKHRLKREGLYMINKKRLKLTEEQKQKPQEQKQQPLTEEKPPQEQKQKLETSPSSLEIEVDPSGAADGSIQFPSKNPKLITKSDSQLAPSNCEIICKDAKENSRYAFAFFIVNGGWHLVNLSGWAIKGTATATYLLQTSAVAAASIPIVFVADGIYQILFCSPYSGWCEAISDWYNNEEYDEGLGMAHSFRLALKVPCYIMGFGLGGLDVGVPRALSTTIGAFTGLAVAGTVEGTYEVCRYNQPAKFCDHLGVAVRGSLASLAWIGGTSFNIASQTASAGYKVAASLTSGTISAGAYLVSGLIGSFRSVFCCRSRQKLTKSELTTPFLPKLVGTPGSQLDGGAGASQNHWQHHRQDLTPNPSGGGEYVPPIPTV